MPNVHLLILDNSSIIFEGEAIALIVLHIPKHSIVPAEPKIYSVAM